MQRVNNAYEILSDPERREVYDRERINRASPQYEGSRGSSVGQRTEPSPYPTGSVSRESVPRNRSTPRKFHIVLVALIIVALGSVGTAFAVRPSAAPLPSTAPDVPISSKNPIVFSDLNWNSAKLQNRIVMYVVEHGYGHPVDTVSGDTIALFDGLMDGRLAALLR